MMASNVANVTMLTGIALSKRVTIDSQNTGEKNQKFMHGNNSMLTPR